METITVNAKALCVLLNALNGPDHFIRELQYTRDRGRGLFKENAIDILVKEFNAAVQAEKALQKAKENEGRDGNA